MAVSASLFRGAAVSLGTMSSSKEGMPALARCAAMREPMVPAPSTAARRTRNGCVEVSRGVAVASGVALAGVAMPMRISLYEVSRAYGTPRRRVKEAHSQNRNLEVRIQQLDHQHHFPPRVTRLQVSHRVWKLGQFVLEIDHRLDFPRDHELVDDI